MTLTTSMPSLSSCSMRLAGLRSRCTDTALVGCRQGAGGLLGDVERQRYVELALAPDEGIHGLALDELHRKEQFSGRG